MSLQKPLAEFIGTFWLVFGGCGSAVLVAAFPVTNVSVNPAHSAGPALWLYWLAPVVGAVAAGLAYGIFAQEPQPQLAPKAVAAGRT